MVSKKKDLSQPLLNAAKRKRGAPSKSLVSDLEDLYQKAMEAGNFTAAIKAKEIIAKELQKTCPRRNLEEFNDQELEILICHLEANL